MRYLAIATTCLLAVACLQAAEFAWQKDYAKRSATGDLEWAPLPFSYKAGSSVKYIDYEGGSDSGDGSKGRPWKHHPWDPAATANAKACAGVHTYVFKGGVNYRGHMVVDDQGSASEPIRLTRDPAWGKGPAVIMGSEIVTGFQSGKAHPDIPEGGKTVSASLDFAPRCIWLVSTKDGSVTRLPLARTPNWTISNWDDIKSEWWVFDNPGKHQDLRMKVGKAEYNAGIDSKHKGSAAAYKDALIWPEWGYVMGTPYPTKVLGYSTKTGMFAFATPWGGKTGEHVIRNNRYYLEDKPHFLDDPKGEFWFDKNGAGGTLHIRFPEGTSAKDWRVEAARHATLIDATELRHVHISGLDFMFTNVRWDLTANPHNLDWKTKEWSPQIETDPACIRLVGSGEDISVTNCRFTDFNKAIRLRAEAQTDFIGDIVFNDNDLMNGDQEAIQLLSGGYWGTDHQDKRGYIGNAELLRNRIRYCGQRPTRYGQGHAMNISYPSVLHVAGNVLDRCWAAGIFVFSGNTATTSKPLSRTIIHQNKCTNLLLNSNDWGQIEHWHGGPAYIFNNVSGNPGGYWHYNYMGAWNRKEGRPWNARFGHAYYSDHGHKGYFFNNIAWGGSNDWQSPLANSSAFQEIGNKQNSFFNNSVHNFLIGMRRQNPTPGTGKYLSNVFNDVSYQVMLHAKAKGAPAYANAHHVGNVDKEFKYHTNAYSNNLGDPGYNEWGTFEFVGTRHQNAESFSTAMAQAKDLSPNPAAIDAKDVLPHASEHDFRSSTATDGMGAKTFVGWGIYKNCAEWNFYRESKAGTVLDEQWPNVRYGSTRYRHHLQPNNIDESNFVMGVLENWCHGAARLNGEDEFFSVADSKLARNLEWKKINRFDKKQVFEFTAEGDGIWNPAIYSSNFLIEVYFQADKGGVLIEKMGDEAGYSLVVDDGGKAAFTIKSGGTAVSVASKARVADGKWHHVLVEADRGAKTLTVYVDGKRSAQGAGLGQVSLDNSSDLHIGGTPDGRCLTGTLEMIRMGLGTLEDSETSIEELYAWQFDGPANYDFSGQAPKGKGRDAGAIESN